jgi:DNA-binding MarR family transcriptional regulator
MILTAPSPTVTIRARWESGRVRDDRRKQVAVSRSRDPIVIADGHWKRNGWDTGWHFRASLSIYRVADLIREHDEAVMRPVGLTSAKHEALAIIYFSRHGEMPLGRLGARLLVHPTSVTSTVDALERLGLVKRVGHPTDRRATLARITPKGRRAIQRTCAQLGAQHSGLDALAAADAQRLFDLLVRIRVAAGDVAPVDGDTSVAHADPVLEADGNWAREGWVDGPWFRAAFSIYRTAELIRQSNDIALRPLELTHVRHEALAALCFSQGGEMPMGRLSERLMVHPTSVTSTVDTLQRLGYVARVPHPSDRRAMLARITAPGRRAVATSTRAMAAARCGVGALTATQARAVFTLLAKVRPAA